MGREGGPAPAPSVPQSGRMGGPPGLHTSPHRLPGECGFLDCTSPGLAPCLEGDLGIFAIFNTHPEHLPTGSEKGWAGQASRSCVFPWPLPNPGCVILGPDLPFLSLSALICNLGADTVSVCGAAMTVTGECQQIPWQRPGGNTGCGLRGQGSILSQYGVCVCVPACMHVTLCVSRLRVAICSGAGWASGHVWEARAGHRAHPGPSAATSQTEAEVGCCPAGVGRAPSCQLCPGAMLVSAACVARPHV